MKIICKYSIAIILLLSTVLSQPDPGYLQDLLECPEALENPNPWYYDFAHYPDLPNNPPPWFPTEFVVQGHDNDGWYNLQRYEFHISNYNSIGIVRWLWCPIGMAWTPDSVMELVFVNGNISYWTVIEALTGNDISRCDCAGPWYDGLPTTESCYEYDGTQMNPYTELTRTFDASGNPISAVYSLPMGGVHIEKFKTETVYSPVHPTCPAQQESWEKIDNTWHYLGGETCEYLPECGENTDTFDPTDYANCVPTYVETKDSDGNVVSTEERTLDIVDCIVDYATLYSIAAGADPPTYAKPHHRIGYLWYGGTNKISTTCDNSNFYLVKVVTEHSEDGENWTNYSRVWISYDGLQMDTEENVSIPVLFELSQNYPNPFNPNTSILYELSRESKVSIKIYSSLGNEIRTLVNEFKPIGQYKVNWDGMDNLGEKVSGGTYFYQIKAGDYSQTRKMVLLK